MKNNRPVTIRPFASNLLDPDCNVPACEGEVEWAVSTEGHDGAQYATRYVCSPHVGAVASNLAHQINPKGVAA